MESVTRKTLASDKTLWESGELSKSDIQNALSFEWKWYKLPIHQTPGLNRVHKFTAKQNTNYL